VDHGDTISFSTSNALISIALANCHRALAAGPQTPIVSPVAALSAELAAWLAASAMSRQDAACSS
jgi:hypothetical protein